jgi:hypothetical protein
MVLMIFLHVGSLCTALLEVEINSLHKVCYRSHMSFLQASAWRMDLGVCLPEQEAVEEHVHHQACGPHSRPTELSSWGEGVDNFHI